MTSIVVATDDATAIVGVEPLPASFLPSFFASYTTAKSRQTMAESVRRLAKILHREPGDVPWHRLGFTHTAALRAKLIDAGYARKTVNHGVTTLRRLVRHAWRLGLMSHEEAERAADIELVKGNDPPPGRHVGFGELAALWEAARDSPRDLALLTLLRFGLRREEVLRLDVSDYADGRLMFAAKGNKVRRIDLPAQARAAVDAWLAVRPKGNGPLLLPTRKNGTPILRRMSRDAVREAVNRLVAKSHIAKTTPHDFRRSLVGDLLDAGVDLVVARDIAGHESVEQTARYDRRPAEGRRVALEKIYVPTIARGT